MSILILSEKSKQIRRRGIHLAVEEKQEILEFFGNFWSEKQRPRWFKNKFTMEKFQTRGISSETKEKL